MSGALTLAAYLAASAVSAGIILTVGARLEEAPAPAGPATVCVGFWQRDQLTTAAGTAGARTPSASTGEALVSRPCDDRPCGTPPDDWIPEPCAGLMGLPADQQRARPVVAIASSR